MDRRPASRFLPTALGPRGRLFAASLAHLLEDLRGHVLGQADPLDAQRGHLDAVLGHRPVVDAAKDFAPSWSDEESALMQGVDLALIYYLVIGDDDDAPPLGEIWKSEVSPETHAKQPGSPYRNI